MRNAQNIENEAESEQSRAANAVVTLRKRLGFSQALFGKALSCSAMQVSRMERGSELSAGQCIQLGNIAGDPICWFFWELAGLRPSDVLRIVPAVQSRLRRTSLQRLKLQIVHAGSHRRAAKESDLVAIPVSSAVVGTLGGRGSRMPDWTEILPTSVFATPRVWCPNPTKTSCFRVKGRSMMPTIPDDCIIVVDAAQCDSSRLYGKIVVAYSRPQGLVISRLQYIDEVAVLTPEDSSATTNVDLNPGWTIVGKVLWWIMHEN